MPMDKEEVLRLAKQDLEWQKAITGAAQKEIEDFLKKNPDKMFTLEEIEETIQISESLVADKRDKHRAAVAALIILKMKEKIESERVKYVEYYGYKS